MTPRELKRTLARWGVAPGEAATMESADRAFMRISLAIDAGANTIDPATWDGIDKGIEREFNNLVRLEVKDAVRSSRLQMLAGFNQEPHVWIATMVNTCTSCEDRHGQVATLQEWTQLGLPGNPGLVCNGNCNCELVPVPDTNEQRVYAEIEALTY